MPLHNFHQSLCVQKKKIRLDDYLSREYPQHPEKSLRAWILCRKVYVDDQIIDKPASLIHEHQKVLLDVEEKRFVSRAGYKLAAAIEHFGIRVQGKFCLDAGISTGGFTDCLLQNGAQKLAMNEVYGVDVGYGDVDYQIRMHPKVQLLERTNIRYLEASAMDHYIDLVTLDLSFISVLKVIPVITELLSPTGELIVLIKPQFEASRDDVEEGGKVTNPEIHKKVLDHVKTGIKAEGFDCLGHIRSPLKGKDAENVEYLAYFQYHG